MKDQISISIEEAVRVFRMLGELNSLTHQPMNFETVDIAKQFAEKNYPEIKSLYYHVVWNWLPKEVQERIENE
jgi:hypothetical protein